MEAEYHIQCPLASPEVSRIQVWTSAPREWSKMAYIEELAKALHHEDPEVRVRVANALQELEDPQATMPLMVARAQDGIQAHARTKLIVR